ncbi:hypothetical protein C8A05DRAFT_20187, partial [Staphylotrichum tortipilum]
SPLLQLSPAIRHHIYRFLGVASWTDDPYVFDLHGVVPAYPPRGRGFRELLLCCRAIYVEVAALLYSANRFVLYYSGPGSLQPLRALTPRALSSLVTLSIILNEDDHEFMRFGGDGDGRRCCRQVPLLHPRTATVHGSDSGPDGHDPSLAQALKLLGEWQTAANRLSSALTTSTRLELSLVCDIHPKHPKAIELAQAIVEPLGQFPVLSDCHIQLCHRPDSQIGQVAQRAVFKARGIPARPPPEKPILMSLPCELRLRILELTDLVTPSKEVWRCRTDSKYHWWSAGGDRPCGDDPSRCSFDECWYCGMSSDDPLLGAFCHRRRAACSSSCKCWAPPGASLFLVCRTWCRDARAVFFSANRFVIHDFNIDLPWILPFRPHNAEVPDDSKYKNYPYERFAASHFLRQVIPANCIASLRFLELVFPPYFPHTWPQAIHPAMLDWRETVGWLQDKINGPALTIRLVGAAGNLDNPLHGVITVAQGDMIHSSYCALLEPRKRLTAAASPNRLAKFYADLPSPWRATEGARNRPTDEDGWRWQEERKRETKEIAEQLVMGDRYDGLRSEREPEQSLWQHAYYYHYY